MKLSQYHKDAIIKAVWAEVPNPTANELGAEIEKAMVKAMSISCRNLYKKNPQALRKGESYSVHASTVGFVCGDANVEAVLKPFKESQQARVKTKQSLVAAVNGCSTRKQFIDRFPEFSYHAPAEHGTCATLPAVSNVVADLVKLGLELKVIASGTEAEK
jgi:hypothetical protein